MKISELVDWAENIDDDDYRYLNRGDEMNLKISEAAQNLKKVGYYLSDLMQKGYLLDDIFSSSKIITAAADGRRKLAGNVQRRQR